MNTVHLESAKCKQCIVLSVDGALPLTNHCVAHHINAAYNLLKSSGYQVKFFFYHIFRCFHTIPACDRWTSGQMDLNSNIAHCISCAMPTAEYTKNCNYLSVLPNI